MQLPTTQFNFTSGLQMMNLMSPWRFGIWFTVVKVFRVRAVNTEYVDTLEVRIKNLGTNGMFTRLVIFLPKDKMF